MYCKGCQIRNTRLAAQLLPSAFCVSLSWLKDTTRRKFNCDHLTMAESLSGKMPSFKRAFDAFDHDQTGEINFVDFPTVVRSLGYNPTNSQVDEVLKAANKQVNDKINFDEFSDMMGKFEECRKEEAEESLREAFK